MKDDPNYRGIGARVPYRGFFLLRVRGEDWWACRKLECGTLESIVKHNSRTIKEAKKVVDKVLEGKG